MRNAFDYCAWKSVKGSGLLGCGSLKEPGKQMSSILDAQFRTYGEMKPLEVSWLNFGFRIIRGVMTYATCGANRLWRLGVVWSDAINNTTYCQIADLTLSIRASSRRQITTIWRYQLLNYLLSDRGDLTLTLSFYETEKITRKASDAAENLQLYRVVRSFHPRSSCTTHISVDVH